MEIQGQYPDIPVVLEEYGSVRACDLVQTDFPDLALVNMELFNIDKFNNSVLFKCQLYFCVSRSHPLAGLSAVKMEQLDNQKVLLFNGDSVQTSFS